MDDVAVVIDAAEVVKPAAAAARQPSRQVSLRLRALAPGSINMQAGSAGSSDRHAAAEVIPLLTPLHVPAAPASDQLSGRHLMTAAAAGRQLHAEVAAGGRCVAVEKTRWTASWWHPAMPPFVNHQPASASAVGLVFRNCV